MSEWVRKRVSECVSGAWYVLIGKQDLCSMFSNSVYKEGVP